MAQVIERLSAQEAMGIQPPRFVYALLIEPGVNLLQGAPFGGEGDSPIFADFKAKVEKADLSDADRRDLIARGTAALTGGFATGYRALIAHLRPAEAKPATVAGAGQLPDGQADSGRHEDRVVGKR